MLVGCVLVAIVLTVGCKPKSSTSPAAVRHNPGDYFQTSFQTECGYIVQTIVADLAEQMYFAAYHRLPDEKTFSVTATEKPGSPLDQPVYSLQIHLDPKQPGLNCDITINGVIWSPQVYQGVATQLAQAVALNPNSSTRTVDTAWLVRLVDGTPMSIERENQRLSDALENDFSNPELHEQAAVLLGSFMLRDHSGKFFEIRSPLCRLTSHLTMSLFLHGSESPGINGQMGEALMLTVVGDEASAMKRLNDIGTNKAVMPLVRALKVRNSGDYRPLDKLNGLSSVESVEWFSAWASYVATSLAWPKLSDSQKQTVDYVRVANATSYSVEVGHELLALSIPLEMREIQAVYASSRGRELTKENLVQVLNEIPDGCFSRSKGKVQVRVIGWGQWADFLQRHLCHAIQQNFHFMNSKWGVPDEAKEFAAKCDGTFNGLRLYPFVRRFNCVDEASYHKSVDDGFKVTVATPQLVPAECWNELCYQPAFASFYTPNPNPHLNEWHSHNPPPGTIYDLHPRLSHPSLVSRADVIAHFEQLHMMAPYDWRIIQFLLQHKYNNRPTYEQAAELFQAVLPYSIYAMRTVANTVYSQPEQYSKLLLKAALLDPVCYYQLGEYEIHLHHDDLAAKYVDQACAADPDSIRVSNSANWRVQYYLKKGDIQKARKIADEAGEVYSAAGLEAKASFLEKTAKYDEAFQWYQKIEERYGNSSALTAFCERYKKLTGDSRFEQELMKRVKTVFSRGIEKVSLGDFHGAPADGVFIRQQNALLLAAGLRAGDVIVALNGTRTHTFDQYKYVRGLLSGPEMDLIVWQNNAYHEIKASPPNHLFGLDFGDYKSK